MNEEYYTADMSDQDKQFVDAVRRWRSADEKDALTMKPAKAKPHYNLADLMAQCDLSAPEPAELAAWNAMQPVGREAR